MLPSVTLRGFSPNPGENFIQIRKANPEGGDSAKVAVEIREPGLCRFLFVKASREFSFLFHFSYFAGICSIDMSNIHLFFARNGKHVPCERPARLRKEWHDRELHKYDCDRLADDTGIAVTVQRECFALSRDRTAPKGLREPDPWYPLRLCVLLGDLDDPDSRILFSPPLVIGEKGRGPFKLDKKLKSELPAPPPLREAPTPLDIALHTAWPPPDLFTLPEAAASRPPKGKSRKRGRSDNTGSSSSSRRSGASDIVAAPPPLPSSPAAAVAAPPLVGPPVQHMVLPVLPQPPPAPDAIVLNSLTGPAMPEAAASRPPKRKSRKRGRSVASTTETSSVACDNNAIPGGDDIVDAPEAAESTSGGYSDPDSGLASDSFPDPFDGIAGPRPA